MPPYPAEVGLQRLSQSVDISLETRVVIEENEVQPAQWLRHRGIVDRPANDRREALVKRRRVRNLS